MTTDQVSDGMTITTIDPQFTFCSYDIKGRKPRRKFRETIKANGFVKRNDSDYYGLFSVEVYELMRKVIAEEGSKNFSVELIPTATTDDIANMLKDRYELKFIKQFEDAEKKLDLVEKALAGDESTFIENKKTGEKKPRTTDHLAHMIADVEHDIRIIEKALGKRRAIEFEEWKLDEQRLIHFENLEKKVRVMTLRADKFGGSIRAQAKREAKGYGGPIAPVEI